MKRLEGSGTWLILRGYDGEAAKRKQPRSPRKPNYTQRRRNADGEAGATELWGLK
jgi:hypothetical protein